LKQDNFMVYCALIFLANIWVYWASVEVYPRYLLMFCPLLFGIFLHLHQNAAVQQPWAAKVVNGFMAISVVLMVLTLTIPLFLPQTQSTPYLYLKSGGLLLLAGGLAYLYRYWKPQRLLIIAMLLLVGRIGFNWFVLPNRNANDYGDACRKSSIEAGERFRDQDLYVYRKTGMQWTNSIYLTNTRGKIIPVKMEKMDPKALYIVDPARYFDAVDSVSELKVRHGQRHFIIGTLKTKH
jgi:hypothetical protein